ncbi:MAG: hypothetical protein JWM44_3790 [Bacilli bacterium]|nr:hypothetical protein [Bacilli bacterium]
MTICSEYYIQIVEINRRILNETFESDKDGLQAKNHSFVKDIGEWITVLDKRPEIGLLETSAREYQQGLIAVVQGQYRQAYNSLRFFLEHSLASINFSANEMLLRLWMRGEYDIYWGKITDPDNGIFSKNFVKAFCDSLTEYAHGYGTMATSLYRQCSEFTHGNYLTQAKLPNTLMFREDIYKDWHEKADTAQFIVSFALCSRYIAFLDRNQKSQIESSIIDRLGHIPIIQGLLEM